MNFYISDITPLDYDEIRNQFIAYFEKINKGEFARYETGYNKDINSKKTLYYAMWLAKGKTPILSKDFMSFLRDKKNLSVTITAHSDFYITFGYNYKIDYTINYKTTEDEVSGYKVSESSFYTLHDYDVKPVYSSKTVLKSFKETRSHNAVGIVKIDYLGNFINLIKTDECDSLSYWPVNPNRQPFFKGSYKNVNPEEIKKLTYLNQFGIPSNHDIANFINGYCKKASEHYSVIKEDKKKIKDKYYSWNIYDISDDNLSISNNELISTFYFVCVNSYTYKIKFTFKGKEYKYELNSLPAPDEIFLEYSPEFLNYQRQAYSELVKQKEKTQHNEQTNIHMTTHLNKLFHQRKRNHFITMLVIFSFFLASFILSLVHHDYLINKAGLTLWMQSMFTWPICIYQITPLLLFGIAYFLYSKSQTTFDNYRFSRFKNYLDQVEVIDETKLTNLKKKDTFYSAILIFIEVIFSLFALFHLLFWLVTFMSF